MGILGRTGYLGGLALGGGAFAATKYVAMGTKGQRTRKAQLKELRKQTALMTEQQQPTPSAPTTRTLDRPVYGSGVCRHCGLDQALYGAHAAECPLA